MKDSETRVVGIIRLEAAATIVPRSGLKSNRKPQVGLRTPLKTNPARLKVFSPSGELPADNEPTVVLKSKVERYIPRPRFLGRTGLAPTAVIEADLERLRDDLTRELRLLERRLAKLLEAEQR